MITKADMNVFSWSWKKLATRFAVLFGVVQLGILLIIVTSTFADNSSTKVKDLGDVKITFPSNWEIVPQKKTLLTIRSPVEGPDDTFAENAYLSAYDIPEPRSLDALLIAQKEEGKDQFNIMEEGKLENTKQPIVWYSTTKYDKWIVWSYFDAGWCSDYHQISRNCVDCFCFFRHLHATCLWSI